jgi:hypothetical protein
MMPYGQHRFNAVDGIVSDSSEPFDEAALELAPVAGIWFRRFGWPLP